MARGKEKQGISTSWQPVERWYGSLVGKKGHFYHKHVIIPGVLKLLNLKKTPQPKILDLACGQGVLAHHISNQVSYTGIDIAQGLIRLAQKQNKNPHHQFLVRDITKPLSIPQSCYTHAVIILAIQNIEYPHKVFKNTFKHLKKHGKLVIVMNHPCFRIPRQSSWEIDPPKKLQYRRINSYLSLLKIPIQAHPGKGSKSPVTWSFHYPLSHYCQWLHKTGFVIERMEEWCSPKISTGSAAKMENRSRKEFPLFLTILAEKTS